MKIGFSTTGRVKRIIKKPSIPSTAKKEPASLPTPKKHATTSYTKRPPSALRISSDDSNKKKDLIAWRRKGPSGRIYSWEESILFHSNKYSKTCKPERPNTNSTDRAFNNPHPHALRTTAQNKIPHIGKIRTPGNQPDMHQARPQNDHIPALQDLHQTNTSKSQPHH